MNNEVVELRAQLQREQQANQDLQEALQKEKEKNMSLERSLSALRKNYENFHNQAEREEENFVNKLIMKIVDLKKGKEKLAYELESEEEHLTLGFQCKLSKLQLQIDGKDREIERLHDEVTKLRTLVKSLHHGSPERDSFKRQDSVSSSDRFSYCSSVEDV